MFLLTALKILYFLDPDLQPFPGLSHANISTSKLTETWEADELVYGEQILNTLLIDFKIFFISKKSPREILKTFKFMYNTSDK